MNLLNTTYRSISPTQLRIIVHAGGAGITLLIAAAGYVLFFAAHSDQITIWHNTVTSGQKLLEDRQQIVEDRDLAECELYAMTRRLEELTALIPHTPESSRFLAQLSELGSRAELEIENFRPGPAEPADNMQRIQVQLSGAARYESVCRFLNGLQSLPRLTRVAKLQISPLNEDGLYPVHMELSIFFAEDQRTSTKVARND